MAASILGLFFILSGLFWWEKRRMFSGKYITGLYFHNPSQQVFERAIKWFQKNNCIFISSEELLDILKSKANFQKRGVWISLDDGWQGNMSKVLPLMKKYNIPVTFFISSGPVERNGIFWFSLVRSFKNNLSLEYQNDVKKLWTVEEKTRRQVVENLEKALENLEKKCPISNARIVREAMTVDDVKTLSQMPQAAIGSHTVNHSITKNCTDAELKEEIFNSTRKLEEWSGKKVRFFSYPNGDYSGGEKQILQEAGIELAAATKKEFIYKDTNCYLVPRFCVNDDAFFPETLCQIVGVWGKWMTKWRTNSQS